MQKKHMWDDSEEQFWDTVQVPNEKKVKCLSCRTEFSSKNAGNRICGSCNERNSRMSKLGRSVTP